MSLSVNRQNCNKVAAAGLAIGAAAYGAYMGGRKVVVVGGCAAIGSVYGAVAGILIALDEASRMNLLDDRVDFINNATDAIMTGIIAGGIVGGAGGFSCGLSLT